MGAEPFDFAVIGSTPLALLLAGLLSGRHGRKVCMVGESYAPYRLPRGFDLSVAPMTRPETWALLASSAPETVKLIAKVAGKRVYERLDPLFVAETTAGRDALGHIRNMAVGFGHAVEPQMGKTLPDGATGSRFRDAIFLHRPALAAALWPWLQACGVHHVTAEAPARAEFTVVVNDAAALELGAQPLRPAPAISLATGAVERLPARLTAFLDRGLVLRQGQGGGIVAIVSGDGEDAAGQLGSVVQGPARRTGEAAFVRATTADGAPVIGLVSPNTFVIAQLGLAGAFLAPPIARFLAGTASAEEAEWIEARGPLADRSAVAEFAL